ncbi:UbiA family prenyltransferase [Thermodesulfobacteriota bacterium]
MTDVSSAKSTGRFEQLKLYFALSRTPHGLLDMATPAFAALLYLGGFPSFGVVLIGLVTAFAGYTAVYALNDIIDYRTDKQRGNDATVPPENYLDAAMVRHPMAIGLLTYKQGLLWATGWALVAFIGAYVLNPMCVVIFLGGAVLETVYCLLWRVSPWRAVVSGFVKNSGPVAALFAVDPHPSPRFLIILFGAFFFWEIGGQNIPNDWADLNADSRLRAKTIPVHLGAERAANLALIALVVALALIVILFALSFPGPRGLAVLSTAVVGIALLLIPGLRLFYAKSRAAAVVLFNRASYFPLTLLGLVLILIMVQ